MPEIVSKRTEHTPGAVREPFANYAHAVQVAGGTRLLLVSGQLGISPTDRIPESAESQADLCFHNIDIILADAGFGKRDVARINAFVSAAKYLEGYMVARDRWIEGIGALPASTLVIVSGFARPEFKVEVEVTAIQ